MTEIKTARQLRRSIGSRKQRKADPRWTLGLYQRKPFPWSKNTRKAELRAKP